MAVIRTRTFRSGNSEAVRLPKEVAYGGNVELVIDVMMIDRAGSTIRDMIARLQSMPVPPEIEVRDTEEIPERKGI